MPRARYTTTDHATLLDAAQRAQTFAAQHKDEPAWQKRADMALKAATRAAKKTKSTAKVISKALLPQGYAMVFGKLRKITAGKPRTGIAKLKR